MEGEPFMDKKFGKRLKKLRMQRGLSQEALSEALGVSRISVSRWETGVTLPDLFTFKRICDYFGCSADSLI